MKSVLLRQVIVMSKRTIYGFILQCTLYGAIIAGDLNAQNLDKSIQEIYITLDVKNVPVKQVLNKIEHKTGFTFAYNSQKVNLNRKVSFTFNNVDLASVLMQMSKESNLKFKRINGYIHIGKREKSESTQIEELINEQEITITGRVISAEDNEGLPGVNVVVKGTAKGTVTDVEGNYKIDVPDENAVLVFSSVGFIHEEVTVGNLSVIDIVMVPDLTTLSEVIVTALGVEKEEKSLGFSVTQVAGEDFIEAREINIANSLQGKVAGVNVSSIASGPAGSSRVVIRGATSLTAQNQPLYVVDGIPIDNRQMGAAGMWGGWDRGDGISNMSPDNIESVTVLKGNAAAALYGSRASNGVILITSKKGTKRKGIGVEYTTNFVVDKMVDYSDFQKEYGSGDRGVPPANKAAAISNGLWIWGSKLDGSSVVQFDGVSRPYSSNGDPINDFFRDGYSWTNTLALSAGNEDHSVRFSATDLRNNSVMPNSGMNRNNFNLNYQGQLGKRLTASAKMEYIISNVTNRPRVSDSPGNATYSVFSLPPNVNLEALKGTTDMWGVDEETGFELEFNGNVYAQNPYFAAYQQHQQDDKDRILFSTSLRYDLTDWLYIQGRLGLDNSTTRFTDRSATYGIAYRHSGIIYEYAYMNSEANTDAMLGWDHDFGDFGVSGFIGGNAMRNNFETMRIGGSEYSIPYFHVVGNMKNQNTYQVFSDVGINSLFGSAEFSFRHYLYLNVTAREDWFSTLDGLGVLYPSASLGWAFSEMDINMPSWLTFGKVRGSWAQVGGGADRPYQTQLTYRLSGDGHLGIPNGYIAQRSIPNSELQPLLSTEIEFGLDLRMFDNRLGLDIAIYDRKTENDILSASASYASGYTGSTVNVGEITNKGIELLINGGIIRNQTFTWDASLNFSYNTNEVISLAGDLDNLNVDRSRTQAAWIRHVVGEPYSQIYGRKFRTNEEGVRVYDANGMPLASEEFMALGTGVHPTTLGLNNSFKFKNFYLDFLIDMKTGGNIYSATNAYGYVRGFHKNTLEGRETGLDIEGVIETFDNDGNFTGYEDFTHHIEPVNVQDYYRRMYGSITEEFVYDASYIKLRQFVLGYNLPASALSKTPFTAVSASLVGRNLLLLWSKTDNFDPESNFNPNNQQGLEMFGVPSTRSFGVNLNFKF